MNILICNRNWKSNLRDMDNTADTGIGLLENTSGYFDTHSSIVSIFEDRIKSDLDRVFFGGFTKDYISDSYMMMLDEPTMPNLLVDSPYFEYQLRSVSNKYEHTMLLLSGDHVDSINIDELSEMLSSESYSGSILYPIEVDLETLYHGSVDEFIDSVSLSGWIFPNRFIQVFLSIIKKCGIHHANIDLFKRYLYYSISLQYCIPYVCSIVNISGITDYQDMLPTYLKEYSNELDYICNLNIEKLNRYIIENQNEFVIHNNDRSALDVIEIH